ncbi:unnamed protein product [Adineta ricciae]|uniref:Uncharacterized protein n=1 Tax=Adineta ricciae TaxID=249248 RepID=A0A815BR12_ADIRI|nr:unnamed protein product [Adineta ricciae]
MSSAQQQPNNSNNSQSQASNYNILSDYEDDPSLQLNPGTDNDVGSWNVDNNSTEHVEQNSNENGLDDTNNAEDDGEYDLDDSTLDAVEKEWEESEQHIQNTQRNNVDEDDSVFSDDVQRAFESYENENLRQWQQTDSIWVDFTAEEQDIMFDEMHECMMYMQQEYSTAEMPTDLVERSQTTNLNPDAAEFCPSWLSAAPKPTTDNELMVVHSWVPCVAQKLDEKEQNNS